MLSTKKPLLSTKTSSLSHVMAWPILVPNHLLYLCMISCGSKRGNPIKKEHCPNAPPPPHPIWAKFSLLKKYQNHKVFNTNNLGRGFKYFYFGYQRSWWTLRYYLDWSNGQFLKRCDGNVFLQGTPSCLMVLKNSRAIVRGLICQYFTLISE